MESVPRCPSRPGGSPGTGGPGRAGTPAAGEPLPGWMEGREKEKEAGVWALMVAAEWVDWTAEGLHVDWVECLWVGAPWTEPCGCGGRRRRLGEGHCGAEADRSERRLQSAAKADAADIKDETEGG